jgi:hypothetical protein
MLTNYMKEMKPYLVVGKRAMTTQNLELLSGIRAQLYLYRDRITNPKHTTYRPSERGRKAGSK